MAIKLCSFANDEECPLGLRLAHGRDEYSSYKKQHGDAQRGDCSGQEGGTTQSTQPGSALTVDVNRNSLQGVVFARDVRLSLHSYIVQGQEEHRP